MAGWPVSPGSLAPGSPSMLLGPDMSASVAPPITRSLDDVRAFVEPRLEAALDLSGEAAPRLVAAMRHALLAPGKRLRPALVLWAADACGGSWADAAGAAIAVEMIHAYSLVHDDLPAMDDDDLRRGQPTCHKAFDEATAILCGDALQALAFETLAREMPPATAARGCLVLARAAGAEALVGGQADDLAAERGWIADMTAAPAGEQVAWLERIHRRKTGALFLAALELGGLSAGASAAQLAMLAAYGRTFGLAFQIADDILDAEGDEVTMGKRVGKDAGRGKLTFPTIVGLEESRGRAAALASEAAEAVHGLGGQAAALEALARWIVARDH
jgi:geranylgeranyl diphosphate synthase type II